VGWLRSSPGVHQASIDPHGGVAISGLVVVGAGGFGCEVYQYALDILSVGVPPNFEAVVGFLDDEPDRAVALLNEKGIAAGFVEHPDAHRVDPAFVYIIGVGGPDARLALAGRLGSARFIQIVHPTAYVAPSAVLGVGVVVCPFAFVGPHAQLGSHVVLNTYASCGHDSRVGSAAVLSPYAVINGDAVLEERVFLGTHATVQPGKRVGRSSSIAAGSVATRDVPAGSLVLGNPASSRVLYRTDT
jgi:sugar O-acyltransferase (sialic acid O-acetyltransferase NeuD family)